MVKNKLILIILSRIIPYAICSIVMFYAAKRINNALTIIEKLEVYTK